jgi:hypothetical protein
MATIVARPWQRCTPLSASGRLFRSFRFRPLSSDLCRHLPNPGAQTLRLASLQTIPTLHRLLFHHQPFLYVSDLTSSQLPGFTEACAREIPSSLEANLWDYKEYSRVSCGELAALLLVLLIAVSTPRAQGPAPETAPPLFPGGGLICFDSTFTARGLMPQGLPTTMLYDRQGMLRMKVVGFECTETIESALKPLL